MLENMSKEEREEFEQCMRITVRTIKMHDFGEIRNSEDYEVLDAIVKTLDYVLVLFEIDVNKSEIIDMLKEWSLICDTKRLHILDDMERCQPADED